MIYNKNSRTLKINGSELMSLEELLSEEEYIGVIYSIKMAIKDYPFILDSKSKIEIKYKENGFTSTYIKSKYGCKNER